MASVVDLVALGDPVTDWKRNKIEIEMLGLRHPVYNLFCVFHSRLPM